METTKKLEGLSAIVDREDKVYAEVFATDKRIEEIEIENATIYIGTSGIVVKTFLSEYSFKTLAEASEIFPTLVASVYA